MHFQLLFGLDAFEKVTERQYRRWKKFLEVFGPMGWRREDWNFANLIAHTVGGKKPVGEFRLRFQRTKKSPTDNIVSMVSAFGVMSQEEINELVEAAEIYG